MIKNPNAQAALDITRGIIHDQRINPTWSPTDDQIMNRIRDYLAESDPRLTDTYRPSRIFAAIRFALID